MIVVSIDLTKIDKSKIKEHSNGAKYYSLTIDSKKEPDKFGNTHTVYDSQSKEERSARADKKFIGSGKEFIFSNKPEQNSAPVTNYNNAPSFNQSPETIDDLPF